MDPISAAMGAMGAIPMIAGLAEKGLDLAKGAMDLANKVMDAAGGGEKIGGEAQQPQGQINF